MAGLVAARLEPGRLRRRGCASTPLFSRQRGWRTPTSTSAGVRVRRNQWVVTLLAAANRDPEVYPDPNRFDITREAPAEHLAFSGGIHYCLGSPLARLELTRAFQGLAERFPRIWRSGPIVWIARTLRGPGIPSACADLRTFSEHDVLRRRRERVARLTRSAWLIA